MFNFHVAAVAKKKEPNLAIYGLVMEENKYRRTASMAKPTLPEIEKRAMRPISESLRLSSWLELTDLSRIAFCYSALLSPKQGQPQERELQ